MWGQFKNLKEQADLVARKATSKIQQNARDVAIRAQQAISEAAMEDDENEDEDQEDEDEQEEEKVKGVDENHGQHDEHASEGYTELERHNDVGARDGNARRRQTKEDGAGISMATNDDGMDVININSENSGELDDDSLDPLQREGMADGTSSAFSKATAAATAAALKQKTGSLFRAFVGLDDSDEDNEHQGEQYQENTKSGGSTGGEYEDQSIPTQDAPFDISMFSARSEREIHQEKPADHISIKTNQKDSAALREAEHKYAQILANYEKLQGMNKSLSNQLHQYQNELRSAQQQIHDLEVGKEEIQKSKDDLETENKKLKSKVEMMELEQFQRKGTTPSPAKTKHAKVQTDQEHLLPLHTVPTNIVSTDIVSPSKEALVIADDSIRRERQNHENSMKVLRLLSNIINSHAKQDEPMAMDLDLDPLDTTIRLLSDMECAALWKELIQATYSLFEVTKASYISVKDEQTAMDGSIRKLQEKLHQQELEKASMLADNIQKLSMSEQAMEKLKETLAQIQIEKESLTTDMASSELAYESKVYQLESTIKELMSSDQSLKTAAATKEQQLLDLISKLQAELADQKQRKEAAVQAVAELDTELQDKTESLTQELKAQELLRSQLLETSKSKELKMEQSIKELQQKLDLAHTETEELSRRIQSQEQELEDHKTLMENLGSVQSEITIASMNGPTDDSCTDEAWGQEKAAYVSELRKLLGNECQGQESLDALIRHVNELVLKMQKENDALSSELLILSSSQETAHSISQATPDDSEIRKLLDAERATCSNMNAELQRLAAEMTALQSDLNSASSQRSDMDEQTRKNEELIEDLMTQLEEHRGFKEETERLESLLADLEEDLMETGKNLVREREARLNAQRQAFEIHEQYRVVSEQLSSKTLAFADLEEKLISMEHKALTAADEVVHLREQIVGTHKAKALNLEAEISRAMKELNESHQRVREVEGLLREKDHRLKEANSRVAQAEHEIENRRVSEANLQQVLEQFQLELDSQIQISVSNLQHELSSLKSRIEELQKVIDERDKQVAEDLGALQAKEKEVFDLRVALDKLNDEQIQLKVELERSMARIYENNGKEELIDRRVVRQLFVNYFQVVSKRKRDVLELIGRILEFSEEDMMAVGLKRARLQDMLGQLVQTPRVKQPPGNVSEKWIEFLMKETEADE